MSQGYNGQSDFAPAMEQQNNFQNQVLGQAYNTQPQIYTPNIADLQTEANNVGAANAYDSRNLEYSIDPATAALRQQLPQELAGDLNMGGELGGGTNADSVSNVLQRSAVNAGLNDALLSGISNPGSTAAGQEILLRSLGNGAIAYRNQAEQNAGSWLNSNQLPTTGLSPGSAVGMTTSADQNAVNTGNSWLNELLGLGQQDATNQNSQLQNTAATTAQIAQQNNNMANQMTGAEIGAGAKFAGGVVGGLAGA